jgi:hypothetical protein
MQLNLLPRQSPQAIPCHLIPESQPESVQIFTPSRELTSMIDRILEIGQLENRLRQVLRGRFRDLRLIARGEGIALQGQCRTYYAKQLAQQAILEATPLPLVANEIEVSKNEGYSNGQM